MNSTRTAFGLAAIFFAAVEVGLGLSVLTHPVPALTSRCQPGSRGNVCIIQRPRAREYLGANIIAVPTATAIPEMVSLDGQVWVRATNLPKDQPITVTLTAPDGTSCTLDAGQVTRFQGMTQAFVTPATCSGAEGVWTASFGDGTSDVVDARFLVVSPPHIQQAR